jgi:hypothetical protein
MNAKIKILTLLAGLLLISYTGYSIPSEFDFSGYAPFGKSFHYGSDMFINNYYNHGDYLYDYYYASRIRRFHRPWVSFGYYNPIYTDCYWYTWEPSYWGISIYLGSMWSPVSLGISLGGPVWYHHYEPYYYDWYSPVLYRSYVHYFHPTYRMVYRTKIINRYYYGGWFGQRVRYSRPIYAYRYNRPYYSNYYPEYGYYSSPVRGRYGNRNVYSSNRSGVRPGNYSGNDESNRSSTSYTGRRRTAGTNTDVNQRTEINRTKNKSVSSDVSGNSRRREVISNIDNNNRRVATSNRTNSSVRNSSATSLNRRNTTPTYSNTSTRVVKKSETTRNLTSGNNSMKTSDVRRKLSTGSSTSKNPSRISSGRSNVSGTSKSGKSYKPSVKRTQKKSTYSKSRSSTSGSKYSKPSSGRSKKTNQVKTSRNTRSKITRNNSSSTSTGRRK